VLLTPKEAARLLKLMPKARTRGDGPPFIKIGSSIRYSEAALIQWRGAATAGCSPVVGDRGAHAFY